MRTEECLFKMRKAVSDSANVLVEEFKNTVKIIQEGGPDGIDQACRRMAILSALVDNWIDSAEVFAAGMAAIASKANLGHLAPMPDTDQWQQFYDEDREYVRRVQGDVKAILEGAVKNINLSVNG
jgi:hypothetical protein